MGFDVNFNNNKPIIKEAQSMKNDGGGGNLGYFEREEKKKKQKEKSIFTKESDELDTFELKEDEDENSESFSLSTFVAKAVLAFKDWYKNNFGSKDK